MTSLLAILRSRWTPAVLVAALAVVGIWKIDSMRRAAEEGRRAAAALASLKEREALTSKGFLAAAEASVDELARQRDGLLAKNADLAAERDRYKKAAGGGSTAAVLDLHTGPVVAGAHPSAPATPAGQGGAAPGDPSADRGPSSAPSAPSCLVLRGDRLDLAALGPVERAPHGTEGYLLKLRATNLEPDRAGLVAEGLVSPDLSRVWTAPPPPLPEEARPSGWMVTVLYGRPLAAGGSAWLGTVHTPAVRLPLLGTPARIAGGGAVLPRADGKGLEFVPAVGLSLEFTRWKR